jgi:hypothetical protein
LLAWFRVLYLNHAIETTNQRQRGNAMNVQEMVKQAHIFNYSVKPVASCFNLSTFLEIQFLHQLKINLETYQSTIKGENHNFKFTIEYASGKGTPFNMVLIEIQEMEDFQFSFAVVNESENFAENGLFLELYNHETGELYNELITIETALNAELFYSKILETFATAV